MHVLSIAIRYDQSIDNGGEKSLVVVARVDLGGICVDVSSGGLRGISGESKEYEEMEMDSLKRTLFSMGLIPELVEMAPVRRTGLNIASDIRGQMLGSGENLVFPRQGM